MRKMYFLFAGWLALFSCNSKTVDLSRSQADTSKAFFPVTDYLLGQINELSNTPVTPLKITSYKGNTDSLWMKPEETKAFVQQFLTPVIDSAKLHRVFKERSFLDQTINAFTFTYDPVVALADTFSLRRWDVYVDADLNTVKRIYIEKSFDSQHTTYQQKLTWRTGQYCKIITINEKDTSLKNVKEEQLIWNFNE